MDYNIDPTRLALSGSSAGAGTSLWLGFHDDLADPKSDDPVLHESTRVLCLAVLQAQTTYDPRMIKQIVCESAARHPALTGFYGITAEEIDTPKAYTLYEKASPINYLNAGDPPVFAFYAGNRNDPPPSNGKPGDGIHHINFGTYLKEKMDKLGIECVIRARDDQGDPIEQMVNFLVKYLKP
jgi:acetyl esterase/lipase